MKRKQIYLNPKGETQIVDEIVNYLSSLKQPKETGQEEQEKKPEKEEADRPGERPDTPST